MLLDPRGAKGLPSKKPTRAPLKRRPSTEANAFAKSPAQPTSAEIQANLDALRQPLIHLLALGSDSESNIAMKTHAPIDLCLRILQKISHRTRAGSHWELDDYVYQRLDLWKFPYCQKDKDTAIKNAEAAFKRLKLPTDAPEWDFLVAPEDRGKVKAGPPPPPTLPKPKTLPKLNVSKVDGGKVTPAEVSPTISEKSIGADHATRSASSQPPSKTRRVGEKDTIARIIANKGKPQKAKKEAAQKEKKEKVTPGTGTGTGPKKGRPPKPKVEAPPKPTKRPTKWKHGTAAQSHTRETQYKSAEIVESDSEESVKATATSPMPMGTQVMPAKAIGKSPLPSTSHGQARVDPPKANPRTISSVKKRTADPPKSTTSPAPKKASVSAKTLASKATEAAVEKAQKERQSSKTTGVAGDARASVDPKAKDGRANEKEQSGLTNSPLKRPSTNSSPTVTGQEIGSVASTPKTLTSIGTVSTPSRCSPNHPIAVASQPVAKGKSRITQQTSSVPSKRKAERAGDIGGVSQPNKRAKIPDEKTILMAKRFKEDYAKYAKLYKEAQQKTSDRPLMDKVIRMHKTLQEMKSQLVKLAAA